MQMIDWAIAYASLGWRVFPLQPKSKLPFPGSRAVHDATTNEQIIRAWWGRTPTASIAIATGKIIDVVDLDVARDGLETYANLSGVNIHVGPTVKTGTGGSHLYFTASGVANTRDKVGPGVETSGEDRYVIAPPSIHPNGRPYEWIISPDAPLVAMPAYLIPPPGNLSGQIDVGATSGQLPQADAFKRCMAYLETVEPAISGSGGHNATFRAACECYRFGLAESEAWNALLWFNANKCQPAWNEKELRHKLRQAKKQVDGDGTFASKLEEHGPDTYSESTGREHANATRADAADAPDSDATGRSGGMVPPKPIAAPPHLLQCPGTVGEIAAWINATAYKPQPILALANSLAFFGAVIGRKVRTPTDLRTNLYCLGVGESGCGKDHSRKAIKMICTAAGLLDDPDGKSFGILSGEDVSSDGAIGNAVQKRNSTLFQLDEIGHFLGNANSKFASPHLKAVVPEFMKLFSSANTKYLGKEYAKGRDRHDIDEPNVCLYGTTVPSRLYDGIGPAEIADGLLARMIVFNSDNPDPEPQDIGIASVPDSIRIMVETWFTRKLEANAKYNLMPDQITTVPFNDEAEAFVKLFAFNCRKEQSAARDGSNIDVLWSRAAEHARKISIIVACGCEYQSPIVTGDIAAWSCNLVEWCIRSFVDSVKDSVSSTEFGKAMLKILRVIKSNAKGIRMKALSKALAGEGMTAKTRREALDELLTQGRILAEVTGGTGRPATTYFPVLTTLR